LSSAISTEASTRQSADESLSTAISAINASDFGKTVSTGLVNGTNKEFPLLESLVPGTEFVYLNGLLQSAGGDYTTVSDLQGNTARIDFVTAPKLGSSVQFAGNIVA